MATALKIQNNYSWLYTDNNKIRKTLWKALRFRDNNYFHSRLYKQKLWDGYNEFFKQESGRFLTGLIPEVEAALELLKEPYDVVDERDCIDFDVSGIDESFMGDPFKLYDYQVELVDLIIKYKRGIIQAPTAAGKSLIMTAILKALPPDVPAIVTSKSTSLMSQVYDDMVKFDIPGAGKVFGSRKADFKPGLRTAVNIDSIHKVENLLPHVKCLIVDEAHLMMSKKPKKYYNKMKSACIRAGVSATPFKFGGKDKTQKYTVKGWFGPILRTQAAGGDGILTTKKLQDREILSSSHCVFYPIKTPPLPYHIYQDAVTDGIAENIDFHNIVSKLSQSLKGRTLILVERLEHGNYLERMIPNSIWIKGETSLDDRKVVIEKLKIEKDVVAIATTGIFNAGVNFFIHNLINAAGGKAEHQIIQRMGRGLRTAKDKETLKYYDFVFHINDYLYDHSKQRIDILKKEGHTVEVKEEVDL